MRHLNTLIAAAALAIVPVLDGARADTAQNLRIFRGVCLAQAPAFDEAAIQRAAGQEAYSARSLSDLATLQWRPGQQCSLGVRASSSAAPVITAAEVEPMVVELFNRLGGGKFTMKRVTKKGIRYRMQTPAGRFEISFSTDSSGQTFYATKI